MKKFFSDIIHRGILELAMRCAGSLFEYADIYVDKDGIVQGIAFTNDQKYLDYMAGYKPKRARP